MRNCLACSVAGLIAILVLSTITIAQTSQPRQNAGQPAGAAPASTAGANQGAKEIEGVGNQMPHYKYAGPPGPAPRQDLNGEWGGPLSAAKVDPVPPMTAWGQEQFAAHKSNQKISVADSNDPLDTCDPLGFPRNALWESRGIAFAKMQDKVVELFQYQKVWREIWTDGRALPKNIDSDLPDSADSRYYGYAVGHWDGDTLVVDSGAYNEKTWLDSVGDPHSEDMTMQERFAHPDAMTVQITATLTDPKIYTKPWVSAKPQVYKLQLPKGVTELEEAYCVPSEEGTFNRLVRDAADGPVAK
jgi:hypothetical protein